MRGGATTPSAAIGTSGAFGEAAGCAEDSAPGLGSTRARWTISSSLLASVLSALSAPPSPPSLTSMAASSRFAGATAAAAGGATAAAGVSAAGAVAAGATPAAMQALALTPPKVLLLLPLPGEDMVAIILSFSPPSSDLICTRERAYPRHRGCLLRHCRVGRVLGLCWAPMRAASSEEVLAAGCYRTAAAPARRRRGPGSPPVVGPVSASSSGECETNREQRSCEAATSAARAHGGVE